MEMDAEFQNQTNLIINYLPQTLTDEEFRTMFVSIGPIKSCKICRDKATGYSYGFGFVDFHSPEDAERAITTLNGLQVQNKRIKVAFARPGGDETKGANVYIRNLPKHFTEDDIEKLFNRFGDIIQKRVLCESNGTSKGVGFILFSKKSEADEAIKEMNGKTPPGGGSALSLKYADDNAKKVRPPDVGYGMIHSPRYPSPYGPVRSMGGNRNRYNPMASSGSYGGSGAGGYGAAGYGATPTQPNGPDGFILFVYNIGNNANERLLWQLFSPYGSVSKVNVIYDHNKGQCKGYGFVTMTDFYEAQDAIYALNGYELYGRQLAVSFKKS